jgi:hypothetical protein
VSDQVLRLDLITREMYVWNASKCRSDAIGGARAIVCTVKRMNLDDEVVGPGRRGVLACLFGPFQVVDEQRFIGCRLVGKRMGKETVGR